MTPHRYFLSSKCQAVNGKALQLFVVLTPVSLVLCGMAELVAWHPLPEDLVSTRMPSLTRSRRTPARLAVLLAGSLPLAAVPTLFSQSSSVQTTLVTAPGSSFVSLPDTPGESPSTPIADPQSSSTQPAPGAPATGAAPATPATPQQTKRILGVLPNFRAVSAGTVLPPQAAKEKFQTGLADSFDYSSFIFAGAQAGIAQATKSYPAFHQGAAGYARYFWHTFADQADENLLVESIIPTVTHEDSRYYTLGSGGFVKRSVYAISRAAITRSDHGGETVNLSEIVGAGAAAGISNFYYPGQYYSWTKTGQRWATNIILDDALLYVKEFWPDINQHLLHQKD